jgi:hypothetical protein
MESKNLLAFNWTSICQANMSSKNSLITWWTSSSKHGVYTSIHVQN